MWKKINASEKFERRMNIFSAHDTTLGRLWQAIDISEDLGLEKPIYGSALIFELHETSTSKYRVKVSACIFSFSLISYHLGKGGRGGGGAIASPVVYVKTPDWCSISEIKC